MSPDSVWITGATQSGKTARLIQQFKTWAAANRQHDPQATQTALIFAAIGDNRLDLADRIAEETQGRYRFDSVTPLGFFQDEVMLFFPLLTEQLHLKAPFPLRLRPETEQELATRLWQPELESGRLRQAGVRDYFMVRRTLDLLQLAAASETPHEDIPATLQAGFIDLEISSDLWDCMGELLQRWWDWCLARGLLTYGIITELYWRYLLPHPTYRQHLKSRYYAVLADDVDEYPAAARSLFEFFLQQSTPVAFTFNPEGGIRVGLGADPIYLSGLANSCQTESLAPDPDRTLGATWGTIMMDWVKEPMLLPQLPDCIRTLQTTSRAQLLRHTAEEIAEAVHSGQVQPQEIAVIGPGVDAIARYTLREILLSKGIPVTSLHDQRPLASSPMIQTLLNLLALVYPGLGRILDREAIAEMLVLLSQGAGREQEPQFADLNPGASAVSLIPHASFQIDPVRAGLLTDHCFVPDPEQPHLLPVTSFPRWDRLGYQATRAYEGIVQWVEAQKVQQEQRLLTSPVVLLDRAIQKFLSGGSHLPYDQLAALRELMETAQHYWEVATRLKHDNPRDIPISATVGQFIQLLREGTITADPYPARPIGRAGQAVTIATIYQYRSDRRSHRWQFWLDAGSPFWLSGGAGLFGAPLFLRQWSGQAWTVSESLEMDVQRLQRQVLDLLSRVTERVYLCHSDLATNGQEQAGNLLTIVNAALPIHAEIGSI